VGVDAVCAHSAAESIVEAASAASKRNRGRISVRLCRVRAAVLDSRASTHGPGILITEKSAKVSCGAWLAAGTRNAESK
jgi:hypothetical protein